MTALISAERFEFAFKKLMLDEGGYDITPKDPGGATNFGVTQHELTRVYQRLGLPATVKYLTLENASTYYKSEWWDRFHYDAINSLDIASKIFNMAVNMGASEAHTLVQRAVNCCGYSLTVDGILGGKTLGAINEITFLGREDDLREELEEEQINFYTNLVQEKPALKIFLNGWLARAVR